MSDAEKVDETSPMADVENKAESEQQAAADAADTDDIVPPKRGRGRPKGSKNKPREGASSSAAQTGEKRKRGRPPKEKTANAGKGDDAAGDSEPPVKRPRGRPRKNPPPADAVAAKPASTTVAATDKPASKAEEASDKPAAGDDDAEGETTAAPSSAAAGAPKKRGRPPKSDKSTT